MDPEKIKTKKGNRSSTASDQHPHHGATTASWKSLSEGILPSMHRTGTDLPDEKHDLGNLPDRIPFAGLSLTERRPGEMGDRQRQCTQNRWEDGR